VSDLQGMSQVAVVGPDDKVEIRVVKLGPNVGSSVVIDSGVAAGERIVVEGIQKVRSGAVVVPTTAEAPASPAAAAPKQG
jgi:membrane fusion protein (multidrug efflux system)